ncbi:MAG: hypothetical protein EB059_05320 [Alphaproteobacteria bacterium]|nr:hypothetical protein [Alphaproteobacteria bacterium]
MKPAPLHFDTFGNLHYVLDSIDRMVPKIFKGHDISFIASLKKNIRMHAEHNKWDMIVLSLSKHMARQEIDIILNHLPEHVGPLVIDATAQTPEHEVIYNETLLLSRKERIIRLNDETGDIMIVLYGVHGIDPPLERKLLMKRMHYMGTTLDMLLERNEDIEGGATEEAFMGHLQRALSYIRSIYAHDASEEKVEHRPIATDIFLALTSVLAAYQMTHDEHLKESIGHIVQSFTLLPEHFTALENDFKPFVNAAQVLSPNLQSNQNPQLVNLMRQDFNPTNPIQNNQHAVNAVLNNSNAMSALENTPNSELLEDNPELKRKVEQQHPHNKPHHDYEQLIPKLQPY